MSPKASDSISEEDKAEFSRHESMEDIPFLKKNESESSWRPPSRISAFTKTLAIVNIVLAFILATSIGLVAHSTTQKCTPCLDDLPDPWSPALGVIVPVIKKFKPELIYQSETSPLVEAAWNKSLGAFEGVVALGPAESARLTEISHESIASIWEPEKNIYGVSMYHQMHCLNIIRQSFYREQFFPNKTDEEFNHHKNHCFDFLRQVIMCHGDLSMTYWWNKNYTSTTSPSTNTRSDYYESLTTQQKAKGAFVNWDIEHKCRMWEPIEDWVVKNRPFPEGVNPYVPPPDMELKSNQS